METQAVEMGCWLTKRAKRAPRASLQPASQADIPIKPLALPHAPPEDEMASQETQVPLGFSDYLQCNQYLASMSSNSQSEDTETQDMFVEMEPHALIEEFFGLEKAQITQQMHNLFIGQEPPVGLKMEQTPMFIKRKAKGHHAYSPKKKQKRAKPIFQQVKRSSSSVGQENDIYELGKQFKLCLSCRDRGFPQAIYAHAMMKRKCSFCGLRLPTLTRQAQLLRELKAKPAVCNDSPSSESDADTDDASTTQEDD